MILRNVSDKPTPELKARGLVNLQFEVGGEMLAPGKSKKVSDATELAKLAHLIEAGALVEEKPEAKPAPAPPPAPVAVEEKKTKKER